jgi:hypothetical protein
MQSVRLTLPLWHIASHWLAICRAAVPSTRPRPLSSTALWLRRSLLVLQQPHRRRLQRTQLLPSLLSCTKASEASMEPGTWSDRGDDEPDRSGDESGFLQHRAPLGRQTRHQSGAANRATVGTARLARFSKQDSKRDSKARRSPEGPGSAVRRAREPRDKTRRWGLHTLPPAGRTFVARRLCPLHWLCAP